MGQLRFFISSTIGPILLTFGFILTGCASPMHKQVTQVQNGMEKHDVLELMGSPHRSRRVSGQDKWTYIYYQDKERKTTEVVFSNGRVVSVENVPIGPTPDTQLKEASSMEEFEKRVKKQHEQKEQGFKDID